MISGFHHSVNETFVLLGLYSVKSQKSEDLKPQKLTSVSLALADTCYEGPSVHQADEDAAPSAGDVLCIHQVSP